MISTEFKFINGSIHGKKGNQRLNLQVRVLKENIPLPLLKEKMDNYREEDCPVLQHQDNHWERSTFNRHH